MPAELRRTQPLGHGLLRDSDAGRTQPQRWLPSSLSLIRLLPDQAASQPAPNRSSSDSPWPGHRQGGADQKHAARSRARSNLGEPRATNRGRCRRAVSQRPRWARAHDGQARQPSARGRCDPSATASMRRSLLLGPAPGGSLLLLHVVVSCPHQRGRIAQPRAVRSAGSNSHQHWPAKPIASAGRTPAVALARGSAGPGASRPHSEASTPMRRRPWPPARAGGAAENVQGQHRLSGSNRA